jgi:hypothetical protein
MLPHRISQATSTGSERQQVASLTNCARTSCARELWLRLANSQGGVPCGAAHARLLREAEPPRRPRRQVLVLVHGSALDVAWAQGSPRVGAILSAFYPGQEARPPPAPLAACHTGRRLASWMQLLSCLQLLSAVCTFCFRP